MSGTCFMLVNANRVAKKSVLTDTRNHSLPLKTLTTGRRVENDVTEVLRPLCFGFCFFYKCLLSPSSTLNSGAHVTRKTPREPFMISSNRADYINIILIFGTTTTDERNRTIALITVTLVLSLVSRWL